MSGIELGSICFDKTAAHSSFIESAPVGEKDPQMQNARLVIAPITEALISGVAKIVESAIRLLRTHLRAFLLSSRLAFISRRK